MCAVSENLTYAIQPHHISDQIFIQPCTLIYDYSAQPFSGTSLYRGTFPFGYIPDKCLPRTWTNLAYRDTKFS